ncbi:hypothetical protein ACMXYR_08200 [Neptuniibacter sp. QD29_5]|uniref:hypothetical protein n=1 Tax=Neptuniibacter sp. QD29_5 TaxID=3398207 RepID=UPI0039F6477C
MLEIIETVIKGLGLLLKLAIEGGVLLDISISTTGRYSIKAVYPPHWNKQVSYGDAVERIVGAVVWCISAYVLYSL